MDLRDNDPYVGGLMALSLSLKVNKSLVRIDLDKDLKKEPVSLLYQRADVRWNNKFSSYEKRGRLSPNSISHAKHLHEWTMSSDEK